MKLVVECAVCRRQKDKHTFKWVYPTSEDRRAKHLAGEKLSHGYCPTCFYAIARQDGLSEQEIKDIIDATA